MVKGKKRITKRAKLLEEIRGQHRIDNDNEPELRVLIGHWLFGQVFFPRSTRHCASGQGWVHVNGRARLAFWPEPDDGLEGRVSEYLGVPYGPKPRLLLLHLAAMALLRNSRQVAIPVGIKAFAKFLGFEKYDGYTGSTIRAQLARLCSGRLELSFDPRPGASRSGAVEFCGRIFEARPSELFGPDGKGFPEVLVLTEEFFGLISDGWAGFNRGHVVGVKANSLAIDLHMWLVLRLGELAGKASKRRIYWSTVQKQFEAVQRESSGFVRNFRTAARLVEVAAPELNEAIDIKSRWGLKIRSGYLRPALLVSQSELNFQKK